MHCSSFQASKKAQPPLLSWFSASLNSVQRTSKIYGCLGEGSEAETEPRFREWRHNLTSWLASSSLTFITFVIPLANLLACGDDPKSLTQLAKNEVFSSSMVSSLVIVLHDKFRHPVSTRQNNWKSSIVIRVAQAFVSSFLFEVLISGILLGLSGTFIFDHSLK